MTNEIKIKAINYWQKSGDGPSLTCYGSGGNCLDVKLEPKEIKRQIVLQCPKCKWTQYPVPTWPYEHYELILVLEV